MIPFFDLSRQYKEIQDEVEEKVTAVMRSGQYIEGTAVKELEKELEEYLGVAHVITCGNGTDAIRIALQAAGIQRGDEVITTPFTFFATAEAIVQAGAVPVFTEINETDFNMNTESLKSKITEKTKAIVPVHIFGMPADMDEINEIAKAHGLAVIEDACQAIGARYKGKHAGSLGTMGCFSFYPTKNLGAFGDGGMITTNDENLANVCRALKSHAAGKNGAIARSYLLGEEVEDLQLSAQGADGLYDPCKYYNYLIGGNSRLDSMQAAVLLVKLKKLEYYQQKRTRIAHLYEEGLKGLPLRTPPVFESKEKISCFHQYAVLCDEKDELIRFLEKQGIGAGSFYPVPLHLQRAIATKAEEGTLPVAENICSQSVCLPIYPELEEEEVQTIIKAIHHFFK